MSTYKDLPSWQFREVVVHEVCHIYEFIKYGFAGHRKNWKDAMKKCGYPNATAGW